MSSKENKQRAGRKPGAFKVCKTCNIKKTNDCYTKHKLTCKDCRNKKCREWRDSYRTNKRVFLLRKYRAMKQRVSGTNRNKSSYLYKGLSLCIKEEFLEWSLNDSKFHELYKAWQQSGYEYKMIPSVDRIESRYGYELCNMEWMTQQENAKLGAIASNNPYRRPINARH